MIGLIVAGLAVATVANRPLLGVLLCMVAATIKAPALIPAAFIIFDAVRTRPAERRVSTFAKLSGAGGARVHPRSRGRADLGWGWIGALGIPGTNRTLLTPTTFLAHWISVVVGHESLVLNLRARRRPRCATLVGVVYLLWRAPKIGTVRACGLALALDRRARPDRAAVVRAVGSRRARRGRSAHRARLRDLRVGRALDHRAAVRFVDARRRADGRRSWCSPSLAIAIAWRPVRAWIRSDLADRDRGVPPARPHHRRAPTCCGSRSPTRGRRVARVGASRRLTRRAAFVVRRPAVTSTDGRHHRGAADRRRCRRHRARRGARSSSWCRCGTMPNRRRRAR